MVKTQQMSLALMGIYKVVFKSVLLDVKKPCGFILARFKFLL